MASQSDFDRMKAIVNGVDHLARCIEKKWGVGQLRLLVDDDLRCWFDRQHEKWGNACMIYELQPIQTHGDAMRRAWEALDKAATTERSFWSAKTTPKRFTQHARRRMNTRSRCGAWRKLVGSYRTNAKCAT